MATCALTRCEVEDSEAPHAGVTGQCRLSGDGQTVRIRHAHHDDANTLVTFLITRREGAG